MRQSKVKVDSRTKQQIKNMKNEKMAATPKL